MEKYLSFPVTPPLFAFLSLFLGEILGTAIVEDVGLNEQKISWSRFSGQVAKARG